MARGVPSRPTAHDGEDGRRRRSEDSRARIVAAMLALVREDGGLGGAPSAEQVAERAEVGLRTVFRHFRDMESLYREMSVEVEAILLAAADQPFRSEDWRGRVVEMVSRRGAVFERIGPFRRAADTVRHKSPFLAKDSLRLVAGLRFVMLQELPPEIAEDPLKLEALDLLLSWEAWSRLRQEQGLSFERAEAVLQDAVRKLIG